MSLFLQTQKKEIESERQKRLFSLSLIREKDKEVEVLKELRKKDGGSLWKQNEKIRALKTDLLNDGTQFKHWAKAFDRTVSRRVARSMGNKYLTTVSFHFISRLLNNFVYSLFSGRLRDRMPPISQSARDEAGEEAKMKVMKAESRVLRQLKGELLRSRTESKETLAEMVRLKRRIDALASDNDEVKTRSSMPLCFISERYLIASYCYIMQLRAEQVASKQALDIALARKSALEKNLLAVSSRCLRAESMAATFENQLKVCGTLHI